MTDMGESFVIWTFDCSGGSLQNTIVVDEQLEDAKFTDDRPFGESLRATPNLHRDHLQT